MSKSHGCESERVFSGEVGRQGAQILELESELEDARNEIRDLRQQISDLLSLSEGSRITAPKIEPDSTEKLEWLHRKLLQLHSDSEKELIALRAAQKQQQDANDSNNTNVSENLSEDLAARDKEIETLKNTATETSFTIERLQSEMEGLLALNDDHRKQIESLQMTSGEKDTEIQTLKTRCEVAEKSAATEKETREDVQAECDALTTAILEKEQRENSIKLDLARQREEHAEMSEISRGLQLKCDELEKMYLIKVEEGERVLAENRKLADAATEIESVRDEMRRQIESVAEVAREKTKLEEQLAASRETFRVEITSLEAAVERAVGERNRALSELAQLGAEMEMFANLSDELSSPAYIESVVGPFKMEISLLRSRLDSSGSDLTGACQQLGETIECLSNLHERDLVEKEQMFLRAIKAEAAESVAKESLSVSRRDLADANEELKLLRTLKNLVRKENIELAVLDEKVTQLGGRAVGNAHRADTTENYLSVLSLNFQSLVKNINEVSENLRMTIAVERAALLSLAHLQLDSDSSCAAVAAEGAVWARNVSNFITKISNIQRTLANLGTAGDMSIVDSPPALQIKNYASP